jgi:PAS domain S-box-containing protein
MAKERVDKPPADFLETILDSLTEGVFTIDPDYVITSFNQAAEEITGFSRQEAIGKKCFEIFQADICQGSCALGRTLKTRKNIVDLPVNILTAQGKVVPISITTSVLKDDQDRMIGGVETFRDLTMLETLRKELHQKYTVGDIIGKSDALQKIFAILPDVAQSDSTILIQGPSGSGKELLAKAIHELSPRKKKSFVAINCSAFPETLLESELFGYVKGAFTDAKKDKPGKLALAYEGTLFLDEIGDLPLAMQVKLLRVLQEKTYEPLGSNTVREVRARIISASNKDLRLLVDAGRFREDLYYRLKVIQINLPTLRERREDIPLLIDHFIQRFNVQKNKTITHVSPRAMEILMNYDYPGNIRELENILEHAFVLCHGSVIQPGHLPVELQSLSAAERVSLPGRSPKLRDQENTLIEQALERHQGNRLAAARELGIHPTTLWRKLKKTQR